MSTKVVNGVRVDLTQEEEAELESQRISDIVNVRESQKAKFRRQFRARVLSGNPEFLEDEQDNQLQEVIALIEVLIESVNIPPPRQQEVDDALARAKSIDENKLAIRVADADVDGAGVTGTSEERRAAIRAVAVNWPPPPPPRPAATGNLRGSRR